MGNGLKGRPRQRPLLIVVSKGSHAGRFDCKPGGYPAVSLQFHTGLPWGVRHAVDWARRIVTAPLAHSRLLTDVAPTDPDDPGDAAPEVMGLRERAPVAVLEDPATVTPDSEHW